MFMKLMFRIQFRNENMNDTDILYLHSLFTKHETNISSFDYHLSSSIHKTFYPDIQQCSHYTLNVLLSNAIISTTNAAMKFF